MTEKKTTWARVQMLLIASVFFGPLVIATVMYYGGYFQPEGRTNHGALLEPIVNVTDELPGSEITAKGDGHWVLIYADASECKDACVNALYTIRQAHKLLGKESERLLRVFLHGESSADTVFLADEHAGLIALRDERLSALLNNKKPAELAAGGYFLMDPLGNLVMYFEPEIDPSDMVGDLKRLLKLSRIG
jgi:cytochrome oxidase Cu insertion factor (SCO1/SenC/PrrC family)